MRMAARRNSRLALVKESELMERPDEVKPVPGGCIVCGRPAAYLANAQPVCWLHKGRFEKAGIPVEKKQ